MGGETYSAHATSASGVQGDSRPKLDFYLVRRDGTHVPMIALDEIDPRFRVAGLPTTLTAYDVEKWNMGRVSDIVSGPRMTYEVVYVGHQEDKAPDLQASHSIDEASSLATSHSGNYDTASIQVQKSSDSGQSYPEEDATIDPAVNHGNKEENHFDYAAKQHKAGIDDHPSKTKDAMTPGVYGKKKYCTYWIRTGNCDYVQEGCKYLHIIPDEETRHSIGIRDMPRWAKEDLPAPSHSQRSKHDHPGMKPEWRRDRKAAEAPTSAKQTSKKITPALPAFLDKRHESNELKKSTRGYKPFNPAAQSFETSKPTHTSPAAKANPAPSHDPSSLTNSTDTANALSSGSSKSQLLDGLVNEAKTTANRSPQIPQQQLQSQQGSSNHLQKPKFFAPDRMQTPGSASLAAQTTPYNPSKLNYAPITYPNPPAPSMPDQPSWPNQQSPWNKIGDTTPRHRFWPDSTNVNSHTKVQGFRTPADLMSSLTLGDHSNSGSSSNQPSAHANAFANFRSSDQGGYQSPATVTEAPDTPSIENAKDIWSMNGLSTKDLPGRPITGGVVHPRLFAREGESKFVVTPVEHYSSTPNGQTRDNGL